MSHKNRPMSLSDAVNDFLDEFSRGDMSPFVEKALRATPEYQEWRDLRRMKTAYMEGKT
jgi:hypothetical protein